MPDDIVGLLAAPGIGVVPVAPGAFSSAAIDRAIDQAALKLGEGKSGLKRLLTSGGKVRHDDMQPALAPHEPLATRATRQVALVRFAVARNYFLRSNL